MPAVRTCEKPSATQPQFTQGKKHTLVHFRGEFTEMPRHPSAEIKTGTLQAILKKLGLKK